MEEGWRVCLVHGGPARDGGGVVDAAEAVRRFLLALAPCAKRGLRAQAHGGRSTRRGRSQRARRRPQQRGQACRRDGRRPGGRQRVRERGRGRAWGGTWEGRKKSAARQGFRPEERGWEGEKWWRARALTCSGRARAGISMQTRCGRARGGGRLTGGVGLTPTRGACRSNGGGTKRCHRRTAAGSRTPSPAGH